ncbi:MAG TPA: TIGR03435 family protein [Bryobacteraceae bacterium]|nr:TIGR03435 family protein [Bryobacteraceae bacterium]
MQGFLLSILALSVIPGSALFAQNITGTWQGTLKANGPNGSADIRTVMKISRADNDNLKALFYIIDRDPTPLSVTSVTLKGSAVKASIQLLNGTFEGTLSSDRNTINGKWTQNGTSLPLNLVRATDQTAWTIPDPPPGPAMMAASAKPEFTVATIKPSNPDAQRGGYGFRGREVTTTNVTVNWMIKLAYNVHARQIEGGPAWLDTAKYDTVGMPDTPGQPSRDQMKLMIQQLLADRFQLKFHTEKRELPVYAMAVLKTGAKITVSAGDPNAFPGIGFGLAPGVLSLSGRNTGLDGVANALQSNVLDKPVVNQTGLTGRYDFMLKFTPDGNQLANFGAGTPGNPADPDAPPDIFSAFQQQLGLKLESTKAFVNMIVIDKIARPSEN